MNKEPYFADFRLFVLQQIKDIEHLQYESYSIEYFLIRYLKRVASCANPPSRQTEMDNAIRALTRFYVDNLEERSDLGERYQKIYSEYRKSLLRQQQK